MQFMRHIDTLSKSCKDAEEEQKDLATQRAERTVRRPKWVDEENEPIDYDEDMQEHYDFRATSVEKYLTYNDPHITSLVTHTFVATALTTARACGLLPSHSESMVCFNPQEYNTDHTREMKFHNPDVMSEVVEKEWRDHIRRDVLALRRHQFSANANITTSPNQHVNKSDLTVSSSSIFLPNIIDLTTAVRAEFHLNEAQERCYSFFSCKLQTNPINANTSTFDTENRCMYLGGPGGTGKSQVIKAIIALFRRTNCMDKLRITATTGVAANLIGGSTIDSLCQLRRHKTAKQGNDDDNSDTAPGNSVDGNWAHCQFLIIDEVSMLGCAKLLRISKTLCKIKGCPLPFGGLFVLFSGDFHQLPAIGDKCLYHPIDMMSSTKSRIQRLYDKGSLLWQQVTETTVLLTEHYRAKKVAIHSMLDRIRCGKIQPSDIELLHTRTFGHPLGPDPSDPKWKNATLVTPRNAVRQAWNNQAALRHSLSTGQQVFISPSIDQGVPSYRRETLIWTVDSKTDMLATWCVLCVGGPAIVTANIAVELGFANGSKVIIREVIPHPSDQYGWQQISSKRIVQLSRPPICVFVEPIEKTIHSDEIHYHKSNSRWFPIMTIKEKVKSPKEFGTEKSFFRIQIPLTSAFALSDYRVQSQGLNTFIPDLKKPPTGKLRLENLYVILSRAIDWENMAILRPFEDSILQSQPDESLIAYDEYLQMRNEMTMVNLLSR